MKPNKPFLPFTPGLKLSRRLVIGRADSNLGSGPSGPILRVLTAFRQLHIDRSSTYPLPG